MGTGEPSIQVAWRSAPAGRLGQLSRAGRIERGRGVAIRPLRSYDAYALMYVYEGFGVYRDLTTTQPPSAGDLVFVVPGLPPLVWTDGTRRLERGPPRVRWRRVQDGPPPRADRPEARRWLARSAGRIPHGESPRTRAATDDETCRLLQLLVEIDRACEPAPTDGGGTWIDESKRRLGDDLGARLELATVAAAVGMSYESWRKQFRARVGLPPARYRLNCRIDAVRELLRNSSLRNREIAAITGFSDEYHLSRQFHRLTGTTPTQVRHT